jgi:hypothetical protein
MRLWIGLPYNVDIVYMEVFQYLSLGPVSTWRLRAKKMAIASVSKKCALCERPTAAHVVDAPWEARSFR